MRALLALQNPDSKSRLQNRLGATVLGCLEAFSRIQDQNSGRPWRNDGTVSWNAGAHRLYKIQIPNPDFKTGSWGLLYWAVAGDVLQNSISEFRDALVQRRHCILECRSAQAGVKFQRGEFNFKTPQVSGFRIATLYQWRCEITKCVLRFPRWWITLQTSSISVIWTGVKLQKWYFNFEQGALQSGSVLWHSWRGWHCRLRRRSGGASASSDRPLPVNVVVVGRELGAHDEGDRQRSATTRPRRQ